MCTLTPHSSLDSERDSFLPLPPEGTVATSPVLGMPVLSPVLIRCPLVGFRRQFSPSRLRAGRRKRKKRDF